MKRAACLAWILAGGALWAAAQEDGAAGISFSKQAKIADDTSPSLVTVQYFLRYDKGSPPRGGEVSQICPSCGRPHIRRGGEEVIREERPLEETGFLVSPNRVVSRDTGVAPRFIQKIRARQGERVVDARVAAYAVDHGAVILEMDKPIEGTKPLAFETASAPPRLTITSSVVDGTWKTLVRPMPSLIYGAPGTRPFAVLQPPCLITDADGRAQGLAMDETLPLDDSWRGSPLKWVSLPAAELDKKIEDLKKQVDASLLHVCLQFRSPAKDKNDPFGSRRHMFRPGGEESETEINAVGIALADKRVLVLAELDPEVTARLERVKIIDAGGKAHAAKFAATLSEYGALIVTADEPAGKEVKFGDTPIADLKNKLVLRARVLVAGEQRLVDAWHGRFLGGMLGQRNKIYPTVGGDEENMFFFSLTGELLSFPVSLRDRASLKSDERWHMERPKSVAAAEVRAAITNIAPANVPLDEKQEKRMAWMGVTLQKMTTELARANRCSEQTAEGKNGALITLVYPDSPAAKAGIEAGMILLRLDVEGEPKPMTINAEMDEYRSSPFPWEQFDRVPPEYLDRLPCPWPPMDNSFTRLLTGLGFGAKYVAQFFHKGKEFSREFAVVESPPHFDSAPRHKSEPLGLTVRDLTFEVRQYMQKKPDDPGVIISKVETGGKAAVAGIKPFEVITHVNGNPVANVNDFTRLAGEGGELNLSVNRMADSRQVRVKADKKSP